jgi:signal transduction histidine kinase
MTESPNETTINDAEIRGDQSERPVEVPIWLVLALLWPFILASLIKPRFLDTETLPTELHINVGSIWSRVMGLIIVFVTIITLIALPTRSNPIDGAKVFFILLSYSFATFAWVVVNHHSYLMYELERLEINASESRDQARSNIRIANRLLADFNSKVGHTSAEEVISATQVLKSFGPLAMMFLKGERNIFKIGLAAAGVASKAVTLFKTSQNK